MRLFITTITLLLFALKSVPSVAKDSIVITFDDPSNTQEIQTKQIIQESQLNELVVGLSNQHFPFDNVLTIQYGGSDGPMYDPGNHTVYIPYTFYQQALDYFSKNNYEDRFEKKPQLGALDTLLHTLLHEAGHAFIHDQSIPILGKEEDAVDNFATLLMIDYVTDGADSAISAADMFSFESEDRPDYYDFGEYIDEHSFDLQRYFSTLCLVYGSDPDTYEHLLDEVEEDYRMERKEFCEFEYQNLSHNWSNYMKRQ
ncbi:DUF4344 domain-containing metallopeptidase [Vibrio sp. 10N.261.55.A7]|uniref:DUF4344 domain-containing metallopeptidase n=1 Tax=Vibrio sp. 10N.261.55.A7 TaxID=1880851 RepID=UPI000C822B21|nr:DUF4344 domain-containing metallopeptidase [Vibrio sp. 10N.261.55.A7]PMJ90644.1 hypothetical protein BCU12_11750 [Vibrio sp. 10N.261.55.A7]